MAKKILLIEYEPRYLDRIRGYLAGKDFDLVIAKDGDEGLEFYQRSRPDLVLISSVLPKTRTSDVIKGLQKSGPTPPVLLMMSGYKGKNKIADAQRVGATNILEKPFTEEVFLSEVRSALTGAAPPIAMAESGGYLLSSDDIFSDVVADMEETSRPSPSPIPAAGTDPGIQKKLEQTLSGILPGPKRNPISGTIAKPAIPSPPKGDAFREDSLSGSAAGTERTVRLELSPKPAPPTASGSGISVAKPADRAIERPAERAGDRSSPRIDASVDKMLTDTLSGLKPFKAPEKPAPTVAPQTTPKPKSPIDERTERLSRPATEVKAPAHAPPPEAPAPKPPARPEPVAATPAAFVAPPAATSAAPSPSPAAAERRQQPAEKRSQTAERAPYTERKDDRKDEPRKDTGDFGRYQMLEKIAAGGMAEVYKARMRGEEGFEKIVAIKRILPHMADNDDFITMFIDEAKLAAQLSHNNIIHIYDLGKVDAYHYIAMEYVDGKDLRSILKLGQERGFPLPPELALFIASKIANALDYAHRRLGLDGHELNLIHRDVSPQNILISLEGDIKLCDFGIAKAATKVSQTQTGALKGKLQYMSPEQAWGKKLDRRTDIFSLGVVLFEMLTGERLFTGDTDLTILEQVRDARVVAPSAKNPELPKRIDQVVLRVLSKNPQDRYQNASEFEKEINAVLYSTYAPAPGPADLAIYMHRLLEASPMVSDEQIDAAFASADSGPAPAPVKKGKGLVISKKAAPAEAGPVAAETEPKPVAVSATPASEVSSPALAAGEQPKSRAGLFAGIGLAAAALVGVGLYVSRKGAEPPPPVPSPVVPAVEAKVEPTVPQGPTAPAEKVIPGDAVKAEAQRILEEQRKAAAVAATATAVAAAKSGPAAAATRPAGPATTSAAVSLAPNKPLQAPEPTRPPAPEPVRPTPEPTRVAEVLPTRAPIPTEAPPVRAPDPAPAIAPPANAVPREGELVGAGEGVVEPKLVRLGAFSGLPPNAKQLASRRGDNSLGTPTVMALVNEKGAVVQTRMVKPSSYKFADEAAVNALKGARFDPPTKNGVKVSMWVTLSIRVTP